MLFLPRLARVAAGLAACLLVVSGAPPVNAQAIPGPTQECKQGSGAEALAIMSAIEADQRNGTRVLHMRISTERIPGRHTATTHAGGLQSKSLWAVIDSDAQETRTIYVFSGPGRLAGTTLLMRDRIGTLDGDAMWLYLRSFGSFSRLRSTARRGALVPGTALTYEDAKGLIATDKYDFCFFDPVGDAEPWRAGAREVHVLARPKTRALSRDLGYRELRLRVDVERLQVRSIDYRDLSGKPIKSYRLEHEQPQGERWLPAAARIEQLANGTLSRIEYDVWLPEAKPPGSLFAPTVEKEAFRPRLVRYLDSLGLKPRIEAELAEADAVVEEWSKRWGPDAMNPREQ